jgi:hypothetical protein
MKGASSSEISEDAGERGHLRKQEFRATTRAYMAERDIPGASMGEWRSGRY